LREGVDIDVEVERREDMNEENEGGWVNGWMGGWVEWSEKEGTKPSCRRGWRSRKLEKEST
jgi:hypothetical protein